MGTFASSDVLTVLDNCPFSVLMLFVFASTVTACDTSPTVSTGSYVVTIDGATLMSCVLAVWKPPACTLTV